MFELWQHERREDQQYEGVRESFATKKVYISILFLLFGVHHFRFRSHSLTHSRVGFRFYQQRSLTLPHYTTLHYTTLLLECKRLLESGDISRQRSYNLTKCERNESEWVSEWVWVWVRGESSQNPTTKKVRKTAGLITCLTPTLRC